MPLLDALGLALTVPLCGLLLFYLIRDFRRSGAQEEDGDSGESRFSIQEIAAIERDIEFLERVIVVADHIQKPHAALYEAVESNFCRGVKYLFVVSNDRAIAEREGYVNVFKAIAQIVINNDPRCNLCADDLIDVMRLPYNWIDFPYIFYQTKDKNSVEKTIAFRGSTQREGITGYYTLVDAAPAYTIARAVLSGAPERIGSKVVYEQFERADVSVLSPLTSVTTRTIQ